MFLIKVCVVYYVSHCRQVSDSIQLLVNVKQNSSGYNLCRKLVTIKHVIMYFMPCLKLLNWQRFITSCTICIGWLWKVLNQMLSLRYPKKQKFEFLLLRFIVVDQSFNQDELILLRLYQLIVLTERYKTENMDSDNIWFWIYSWDHVFKILFYIKFYTLFWISCTDTIHILLVKYVTIRHS